MNSKNNNYKHLPTNSVEALTSTVAGKLKIILIFIFEFIFQKTYVWDRASIILLVYFVDRINTFSVLFFFPLSSLE